MDVADDYSDTMSQTSLRSRRSLHSMRPPGTPGMGGGGLKAPSMPTPGGVPRAMPAAAPPSVGRRGSVRGGEDMPMARVVGAGIGDDGMSDASRDVGGLELEGWDEKFVYKVGGADYLMMGVLFYRVVRGNVSLVYLSTICVGFVV